jgi:hypothetical protein
MIGPPAGGRRVTLYGSALFCGSPGKEVSISGSKESGCVQSIAVALFRAPLKAVAGKKGHAPGAKARIFAGAGMPRLKPWLT